MNEEKIVRYIGCDAINLRGFVDAKMGGKYAFLLELPQQRLELSLVF